jgi:hypothetical protein
MFGKFGSALGSTGANKIEGCVTWISGLFDLPEILTDVDCQ